MTAHFRFMPEETFFTVRFEVNDGSDILIEMIVEGSLQIMGQGMRFVDAHGRIV